MNSKKDHANNKDTKKSKPPRVSLQDIIGAMEVQSEEITAYLNSRSGKAVNIMKEEFRAAESGEDNGLYDPEELEEARGVLEGKDYIALPDRFEIDEYSMMREFALNASDNKTSDALLAAIQGAGAFRRFKDVVKILGAEQEWFDFRTREYEKLAVDWCEQNGIEYER